MLVVIAGPPRRDICTGAWFSKFGDGQVVDNLVLSKTVEDPLRNASWMRIETKD